MTGSTAQYSSKSGASSVTGRSARTGKFTTTVTMRDLTSRKQQLEIKRTTMRSARLTRGEALSDRI